MTTRIFEDLPSRKDISAPAPKAGESDRPKNPEEEKRIRQAIYDIRYRARRENIPLAQAFSQYMQNSSLNGVEKIEIRKKLLEEYVLDEMIVDNVATAMFKVFVEGVEEEVEELEYLQQLAEMKEKKYKVRVTDKNSGRSYIRYATRQKINELRANPNIESVEMTEYGEPYEGERKKGEQTARATSGRGLDPVGKEDSDVNNDGKVNKTDKYLLHRREVRGKAIASQHEAYNISEITSPTVDQNDAEIVSNEEKGVDNYAKKGGKSTITLFPTIKPAGGMQNEEVISEKAVSTAQQKFMGMVHAFQKGEMKDASPEVKKAAASMSDTEAEKFASTKHTGLPAHVAKEEVELDECGMPIIVMKNNSKEGSFDKMDTYETDDVKKINTNDSREKYSKDQKVKNTLHSMGAKKVMVVGEENIDELNRYEKETGKSSGSVNLPKGQPTQTGGRYADPKMSGFRSIMAGTNKQPRGQKKVKGQKPPVAGEFGAPKSPAQKVAISRDRARQAQEFMNDTKGT
jgi:hypothetical protein